MLFATQKHPKGPSLTRWQHHAIALSGNILHIDLPPGNDKDMLEFTEISTEQFDIYNTEAYKYIAKKSQDICSINTLFTRNYCYRSFLYSGLGSMNFTVYINQVYDRTLNLFKLEQLHESVNKNFELTYSEQNVQVTASDPLIQNILDNTQSPLTWQTHKIKEGSEAKTINYAITLTEIHFINITFSYPLVYVPEPPWVLMGYEMEKRIMNAIRIEFSPSVLQEQQAAREA